MPRRQLAGLGRGWGGNKQFDVVGRATHGHDIGHAIPRDIANG